MAEERPGRLEYVSPIYNFQASFLVRLPLQNQLQLLRDIHILHYARRDKPWLRPPSRANLGRSCGGWLWKRPIASIRKEGSSSPALGNSANPLRY